MTKTAEQIVEWAEQRAGAKREGRAGHLTPEQKNDIRIAYFEGGGNVTIKDLAVRFNVNRDTVSACLRGPEFDRLKAALEAEIKASAIQRLKDKILPAADAWGRAVEAAADKGNHVPAKDLLLHTGTIDPLQDGRPSGPLVLVAIRTADGRPAYRDGTGATYERDPETGEVQGLSRNATYVAVGVHEEDVSLDVGLERQYRDPATGETLTEAEKNRRAERGQVIVIDAALPGLPRTAG